jgi:hypothetical protein
MRAQPQSATMHACGGDSEVYDPRGRLKGGERAALGGGGGGKQHGRKKARA